VIRSPVFQTAFASKRLGSAQARINLGDLRQFPVPLPPLDEQREIVARIREWNEKTDAVVRRLTTATELVDRSFRGAAVRAFRATPLADD
jgi:type I restriction enzyme, S subunit